ncbi:MAG TPA: helix-turn-helix domain-containing protein [Streptosporangiaceae bacterium]|jgi:antitoxin component HigA of HigAB toxin-antitoxin module
MGFRRGVSSSPEADDAAIDEELSRLITEVTNEINWRMREDDATQADLAGRMGVSPGRVSQVLSGGENLTLRTLVSLATALDGRFEVQLRPYKPSGDSYAGHGADAGDA